MSKETPQSFLSRIKRWAATYRSALVIALSFLFILLLVYWLGWWETAGILFLKFGLGAKVTGAKSFTHAIIKAGGKKAIAVATAGMLAKRHIIDLVSRFFAEHSIKRYRHNLILVLGSKFNEIRYSSPAKKLKAFGGILLSIPLVHFFWTKVLGTAIQKFIYALLLPLLSLLWRLILASVNFLGFIFEILMLNLLLDALENYYLGRKFIALIDYTIHLIGTLLNLFNNILGYIGLNPKIWVVRFSIRFNQWLETLLDKGLSKITRVARRRDRYINAVEALSEKRYLAIRTKCEKKISFWHYTKKCFKEKVLKQRVWRERRRQRQARWEKKVLHASGKIKRKKYTALRMPYHTYKKSGISCQKLQKMQSKMD